MRTKNHTVAAAPDNHLVARYVLWAMVIAGTLLLYGISLWWGELNQDEGWYLYAGRMVAEGQLLYRDFAFTQGPVMAYVYAALYPVIHWQGVLGGRLATILLGWCALVLAVYLVRNIALRDGQRPLWPMLLVTAFWGLSLYQVYFTTIVKTYALAAVCMLAGLVLLEQALSVAMGAGRSSRKSVYLQSFLGGIFLALAAGVRLSAIFLLPACWLPLFVRWIRLQRPRNIASWLWGTFLGGTFGIVLVFGPFLVLAPDGVSFGLVAYHTGRIADTPFVALAYKMGFVLRLVQGYWPLFALALLLPWSMIMRNRELGSKAERGRPLHVPLAVGFVVVTLVHFTSVFPYDDYQVFVMPLIMILLALALGRFLDQGIMQERIRQRWVGALLIVLLGASLSSALLQGWLVGPRNLIWWPLREQSSLGQLREIGRTMRMGQPRHTIEGKLLTQDTYLAVESGYRVPAGMELGPFANFWGLSDADAVRYGVLNHARALDVLANTDAEWAAYSGYGFAIAAPSITPIATSERDALLAILQERFDLFAVFPDFGQAMTDLYLYRREPFE